jgi:hypothetical protein
MPKNPPINIENWNAGVMASACVILGIVFGFVFGALGAPQVNGEPWLKTYGGFVAALISLVAGGIGLWVATWNVLRQVRINLMSREEDRMEKSLGPLQRWFWSRQRCAELELAQAHPTALSRTHPLPSRGHVHVLHVSLSQRVDQRVHRSRQRRRDAGLAAALDAQRVA